MNRRLASFLVRGLRLDLRSGWLPIAAALIGALSILVFSLGANAAQQLELSRPGGYILGMLVHAYLLLMWGMGLLLFSGSVAVEREEGSLDLLRSAGFSGTSLYLGLTGPSLLRGGLLLLPMVPVLSLSLSLGGVTPPFLVSGLLLLVTQIYFLHGACSLISVVSSTRRWALFGCFMLVAVLHLLLEWCAGVFDDPKDGPTLWRGLRDVGDWILPIGALNEFGDSVSISVLGKRTRLGFQVFSPAPWFLAAHAGALVAGTLLHLAGWLVFCRRMNGATASPLARPAFARLLAGLRVAPGRFVPDRAHGHRLWSMEYGAWRGLGARLLLLLPALALMAAWPFYPRPPGLVAWLFSLTFLLAMVGEAASGISRLLEREQADGVLESLAGCPGGVGRVLWEQSFVALRFPVLFLLCALACAGLAAEEWWRYLADPDQYAWPINPAEDRRALMLTLASAALAWPFAGLFTRLRWPAAGGMLLSGAGLALALVIAFLTMELTSGNRWAFDRPAFFHFCALAYLAVIPLCCLRIRHLLSRATA